MEISGISSSYSAYSMSSMTQAQKKPEGMTEEMAKNLASQMIENNDEDGDGALSLAETGMDEDAFGALDTDGDGVLSTEEASAGVLAENEDLRSLAPPPPFDMGSQEESDFMESVSSLTSQQGYTTYQSAMESFMSSLFTDSSSLIDTSSLSGSA